MDVSSLFLKPKGSAYFDSAATSLTTLPVLQKMQEYYENYRANIHRGAHHFTRQASEEYEQVYEKLAKFFHASSQEFVSVRNTTEAINAVALGMEWKEGDEVVVTEAEHHSNLLPWLRLKSKGVKIRIWEADNVGKLWPEKLAPLVSKKTRLVAFTACSNVLGTKIPVKELAKTAKEASSGKALVLVDAAQYVGHHPVDVREWPVEFLAFSGHKCFGPTGIGVLFHDENAPLQPWFVGGGTIREASLDSYTLLEHRERFEAGTPAIAEWIGLGAALDTITKIGYSNIEAHDKQLVESMLKAFQGQPHNNVQLYGPVNAEDKSCALFAFNVRNLPHHETAVMLDQLGFAMRSGHHCAMPLTKKLGVEGTVRASLHLYNTAEEVEKFGQALKQVSLLA